MHACTDSLNTECLQHRSNGERDIKKSKTKLGRLLDQDILDHEGVCNRTESKRGTGITVYYY